MLKDKVAMVTGAGQGLGRHLAERLSNEGCKVAVLDINEDAVKETASLLKESIAIKTDVTKFEQLEEAANRTVEKFGRIDILVSNAAILIAKAITEFTPEEWRKMIDVNLTGYFLSAKAVVPYMIKQRSGCIIQINSKSGKKGSYKNSAYASSKFGGIGLTQSLALELAEYNIRVNAICPGNLLNSPLWRDSLFEQYARNQGITKEQVREKYLNQVPLKRSCEYEDVANGMVFLASDQSSYMTGQAINVTGGQEMR
jgi:sorbitol-6-phosphate 2-dehydrogenase